ncbi:MAG: M20/M25/M40 family metallo-hydrolase [Thermoanaerobaculia bacterium]|jgi:glutamate carboxypeptidase
MRERSGNGVALALYFVCFLAVFPTHAASINETEARIVEAVEARSEEAITALEELVNINSGTMNPEGIRRVGDYFERELGALGFTTRWIDQPPELERGGHLFAEVDGDRGQRILMIGHLDTVFEPDSPFQHFRREGDLGYGPGAEDMKGGNLVILYALKALHDVGALDNTRIIVALTGDEENPGKPVAVSRQDLIEAGRRSDIALGFEAGVRDIHTATIARRGASFWTLRVTAKPAHSSGIFDDSNGAGAVFETSRILDAFYSQIRGEQYLTFNPGVILGGTSIDYDPQANRGTAFGKTNVIAETAVVHGDLRFLSEEQKELARERMRAIVALSLPGAEAEISFEDGYPAMFPTQGNHDLLAQFEGVSRDLGFGELEVLDPGERGAADISFVAADVEAGLAGLGPVGWKGHTVDEHIDLTTLSVNAKRVAVLIYRLTR